MILGQNDLAYFQISLLVSSDKNAPHGRECKQPFTRPSTNCSGGELESLKSVWAEFSILSWAVLQNVYSSWPIHTRPSLDLKTRPRFRPVSLSLSMVQANTYSVSVLQKVKKFEKVFHFRLCIFFYLPLDLLLV
jgi:hypothetical protein